MLKALQAFEADICAIVWSPTRPSLVMALYSPSMLLLLDLTRPTSQPDIVDLSDAAPSSTPVSKAVSVSTYA